MAQARKGPVIFQISNTRHITVRKIPGSPVFLVRECYQTPEAPTGWYELYGDSLVRGSSHDDAAARYLEHARRAQ